MTNIAQKLKISYSKIKPILLHGNESLSTNDHFIWKETGRDINLLIKHITI